MIYLISTELRALEEISKMCGEVKSKEKDKTASTPLVTVSDLQRLNKFEIIVLRRRLSFAMRNPVNCIRFYRNGITDRMYSIIYRIRKT